MKAIFKIQKVKTSLVMFPEDTLNYNSSLAKKERDFLNYIKSILNQKILIIKQMLLLQVI